MSSEEQKQPSMIGGHAKYVQGAVSDLLGYATGKDTKDAAVQEMREAKAQNDTGPPAQSGILGTVESAAGKVTGCEGMVEEGEARKPQA